MTTTAVLLAAGAGTRWKGPTHKLLAPFADSTVIGTALAHAIGAGLDEVIVVAGAVDLDDVVGSGVTLVVNDDWATGMAGSLRVGIDVAERLGHDVVVVGLGDQPGLTAGAWSAVAAAPAPIAIATYHGRRGHPVRLDASVWPQLPVGGEGGARELMRLMPELVREVPCDGDPTDIDILDDLAGRA